MSQPQPVGPALAQLTKLLQATAQAQAEQGEKLELIIRGQAEERKKRKEQEQEEQDDQGQEDEEVSDSKRPRNYHPPESPVRRVFEDGVEVGPPFPGAQLAHQGQAQQFATPGYPQSLYPA